MDKKISHVTQHREDGEGRHRLRRAQVPTRKRQSESLNDVSSNGSFHDEGAHLPALLSNFDNFISREKTPRYGSRSRKSPVNPIVADELGRLRRPNLEEQYLKLTLYGQSAVKFKAQFCLQHHTYKFENLDISDIKAVLRQYCDAAAITLRGFPADWIDVSEISRRVRCTAHLYAYCRDYYRS
ncbi:hypothetical protein EAG_01677 [Camponotus floridanus]|uniref:Uncharacterized protein n=1 Tax=Camponotus floridanus TaxID=104421 RepID=E2AMJ2_CAMFO|nr:hypothetical protein EAG_01677 [Camponotus floridanus]